MFNTVKMIINSVQYICTITKEQHLSQHCKLKNKITQYM